MCWFVVLISLPPDIEPLFGVKGSWRGTWVVGSRVVCTEDAGEEEANDVVRVRASSVNCLKANMEEDGKEERGEGLKSSVLCLRMVLQG